MPQRAHALGRIDNTPGQGLAKQAVEMEAVPASGHAQDIPCCQPFHAGNNREVRRSFVCRENNVGTAHIRVHDYQGRRLLRPEL